MNTFGTQAETEDPLCTVFRRVPFFEKRDSFSVNVPRNRVLIFFGVLFLVLCFAASPGNFTLAARSAPTDFLVYKEGLHEDELRLLAAMAGIADVNRVERCVLTEAEIRPYLGEGETWEDFPCALRISPAAQTDVALLTQPPLSPQEEQQFRALTASSLSSPYRIYLISEKKLALRDYRSLFLAAAEKLSLARPPLLRLSLSESEFLKRCGQLLSEGGEEQGGKAEHFLNMARSAALELIKSPASDLSEWRRRWAESGDGGAELGLRLLSLVSQKIGAKEREEWSRSVAELQANPALQKAFGSLLRDYMEVGDKRDATEQWQHNLERFFRDGGEQIREVWLQAEKAGLFDRASRFFQDLWHEVEKIWNGDGGEE